MTVSDDDDFDELDFKSRKKRMSYSKTDENPNLRLVLNEQDVDEEEESEQNVPDYNKYSDDSDANNSGDDNEDDEENPLLNDLTYETGADKKKSKTNMWYNKVIEYNWNFSIIKSKLIAIFLRLKEAFDFLKDVNDVNNEIMNNLDLNEDSDTEKQKSKFDGDESEDSQDSDDSDDEDEKKTKNKKKKGKKVDNTVDNQNEKKSKIFKIQTNWVFILIYY